MKLIVIASLIAGVVWVAPGWAQDTATTTAASGTPSKITTDTSAASAPSLIIESGSIIGGGSAAASAAAAANSEWQGIKADIQATADVIARLSTDQRQKWERAVAALPGFCHEWEKLLHDREIDNVAHLDWRDRDGYEIATYTGYGKVRGCEAKESTQGIPIGKVIYDEKNYYLVGKSIDEAKSHPKLIGTTNTLEIFSWEKDRWFY